jgi:hypothetical protein
MPRRKNSVAGKEEIHLSTEESEESEEILAAEPAPKKKKKKRKYKKGTLNSKGVKKKKKTKKKSMDPELSADPELPFDLKKCSDLFGTGEKNKKYSESAAPQAKKEWRNYLRGICMALNQEHNVAGCNTNCTINAYSYSLIVTTTIVATTT